MALKLPMHLTWLREYEFVVSIVTASDEVCAAGPKTVRIVRRHSFTPGKIGALRPRYANLRRHFSMAARALHDVECSATFDLFALISAGFDFRLERSLGV